MAAPNLGQGIDRGNYRRRSGITPPAVQGKAAGAVAETVFFGTATASVTHATTGVLVADIGSIVGSAARAGGAVTHATTGALTGQGSTVAGTSARTRQFATSGALTGQGSTLAGSARHNIPHPATGTLTGPGSSLAGASTRTRAHPTTGALTGTASTLTGSAARTRAHATSGTLTAGSATIVGVAARSTVVIHDTSGVLTGPGAIIVGDATLIDPPRGGGGSGGNAVSIQLRDQRKNQRGWDRERAVYEHSLREFDRQRRADLERIAQTLVDSGQVEAQRIARKLVDYTGELTQIDSLQRELAKLEAAQRSRELWAERNQDVQAAAAELSEILRDDEDVAGALVALHEHETRLMLGVLGITMK